MEIIDEHYIDLRKVLAAKNVNAPRWVISLLNRLLHVDEINAALFETRHLQGIDFASAILERLQIRTEVVHPERIPLGGSPIVIANHPLGGPDGMGLIAAVGQCRRDIVFPVNDFLLHIPQLRPLFVPIDKVHGNRSTAAALNAAFAESNCLLYFPAGLCSRRVNGRIVDLQWKFTFVKKAIAHHRDIVPVHIHAQNRSRFYTIANLRRRLGIKFNFEMALLPSEMFAQQGETFTISVGNSIPWQQLDDGTSPQSWADRLHDLVYAMP